MVGDTGNQAAAAPPLRRTLFTSRREFEVAALLEEMAARAPGVTINAHPGEDRGRTLLGIVLTSRDEGRLEAAAAWLAERLPGQPAA